MMMRPSTTVLLLLSALNANAQRHHRDEPDQSSMLGGDYIASNCTDVECLAASQEYLLELHTVLSETVKLDFTLVGVISAEIAGQSMSMYDQVVDPRTGQVITEAVEKAGKTFKMSLFIKQGYSIDLYKSLDPFPLFQIHQAVLWIANDGETEPQLLGASIPEPLPISSADKARLEDVILNNRLAASKSEVVFIHTSHQADWDWDVFFCMFMSRRHSRVAHVIVTKRQVGASALEPHELVVQDYVALSSTFDIDCTESESCFVTHSLVPPEEEGGGKAAEVEAAEEVIPRAEVSLYFLFGVGVSILICASFLGVIVSCGKGPALLGRIQRCLDRTKKGGGEGGGGAQSIGLSRKQKERGVYHSIATSDDLCDI